MPTIHYHISDLRVALQPYRTAQRIALVPTMGNLHDGHLELVKIAKQHAEIVVVSIFVNPTQFGVGEDFDSYPRTLDEDVTKLAMVGADYVFSPTIDEMYPVLPPPTTILAGTITEQLCGKTRPNHFDGVGIVVSKLFNIVQPNIAVFGQKDYQQLAIIKQLVRDLSYSIDIIGAPIIRATDGLALSSRNQYLSESERQTAPILQQELQYLAKQISDNKQPLEVFLTAAHERITSAGFMIDYLEVKTTELTAVDDESINNHQVLVILVAAWLGRARLLDNRLVTINKV